MIEQFLSNFAGGEVSKDVLGRYDSELYRNILQWCQNFFAMTQGALVYRGGTTHVHPARRQQTARSEKFQYTDEQSYVLEFTDGKLRIYEDKAVTLNTSTKAITGATQANPVAITSVGHSLSTGDEVYISGVVGMTELNGRFFLVDVVDADTLHLQDLFSYPVDGTGFTAYSSGGTAAPVYELTSPYTLTELDQFQFDQEGNVAYFAHRSFEPYKLTRVSASSWTFATYVRTADPFSGAGDYPAAVSFFEGCIYFASSTNNPDRWWRSRGPDATGATRYDDFTTGSDADHAIIATLSAQTGSIAYIHWITTLADFLAFGTEGGIIGLDGGGDAAITPSNFRIRPIDPIGVQPVTPVTDGQTVFYVQKGGRKLLSFEYSLEADRYKSFDRSFLAPHLTVSGIKKIVVQRWRADLIWVLMNDGRLVCVTLKPKEDPSGWQRHVFGGTDSQVVSMTVLPQVTGYAELYLYVQRTVNGTSVVYQETMEAPWEGVDRRAYFTGDEDADETAFLDEVYESQRGCRYLDSGIVWDGSDRDGLTMTPGATTGTDITFTASGSLFTSADVGKKITKKYQNRTGGGQALITAYVSATEVTCDIEIDFDSTMTIGAGDWTLTTDSVTGLHFLEGETVSVVADGRKHVDAVVTDGVLSLTRQAGVVHIGYSYRGIAIPMFLVLISTIQNSISFGKNISSLALIVSDTIGVRYGTSLYDLQEVYASEEGQLTDRPPVPKTGTIPLPVSDTWSEDKSIIYVQDDPYPCVLNAMNLTLEVGEK